MYRVRAISSVVQEWLNRVSVQHEREKHDKKFSEKPKCFTMCYRSSFGAPQLGVGIHTSSMKNSNNNHRRSLP